MTRTETICAACGAAIIITMGVCTALTLHALKGVDKSVASIEIRTLDREQQLRRLRLRAEDLRTKDLEEWIDDYLAAR